MFDNLTKEIIYYSFIPVILLAIIGLVLLVVKKKEDNKYKYNYVIKIILMLIDGLVLSLLIGYAVWATERFIRNGTVSSNVIYILLFVVLIIALIVLLVLTCTKLYHNLNNNDNYLDEKETS